MSETEKTEKEKIKNNYLIEEQIHESILSLLLFLLLNILVCNELFCHLAYQAPLIYVTENIKVEMETLVSQIKLDLITNCAS